MDNSTCASAFIDGSALTDNQLCFIGDYSVFTRLYGGTCQGDSGGPVYWKDGADYRQVGITSFGTETCGGGSITSGVKVTSVFTEILDYEAWIDSVVAGNETPKFVSTDAKRTAYVKARNSSGSNSGGSVSFGLLGILMLIAGVRQALKR